jgi:mRNA-degrading endonuclease YafQ of YafQ-DinJ toxin-antitoxin module
MYIEYRNTYKKMFQSLSKDEKVLTKEVLELFIENPNHPSLRNHPLDPPLERYRTISVDDDLRILFRMIDPDIAIFLKIGTHEEVYRRMEKTYKEKILPTHPILHESDPLINEFLTLVGRFLFEGIFYVLVLVDPY